MTIEFYFGTQPVITGLILLFKVNTFIIILMSFCHDFSQIQMLTLVLILNVGGPWTCDMSIPVATSICEDRTGNFSKFSKFLCTCDIHFSGKRTTKKYSMLPLGCKL